MNRDEIYWVARDAGIFGPLDSANHPSIPALERFAAILIARERNRVEMAALYEQLRVAIDGGSESFTHADALKQIKHWRDACAEKREDA